MVASIFQIVYMKASKPLIWVLVINDNIYGLKISSEKNSIGWSMRMCAWVDAMKEIGDDMDGFTQGKRYMVGLFYFAGHEAISDWNMTGLIGYIAVLLIGKIFMHVKCQFYPC